MRSCLALPACFAFAACGFDGNPPATGDGGGDAALTDVGDAPTDAVPPPDVPVDPLCFGTIELTYVCLAAAPTTSLRFEPGDSHGESNFGSLYTNAGSEPLCVPLRTGSPNWCVVAATSITITRKVGTYGPRPIVFLATEGPLMITGAGSIDSASGRPGMIGDVGPGSGLGPCEAPAANGNGGGAAGGSFGALGGSGGAATNGIGGQPGGVTAPVALRGGCPGGTGKGPSGTNAGPGGLGGGAIALIANAIDIGGFINASGGGGAASTLDDSGGGGGGSGGLIVLDTPNLMVGGKLFADGGGGGGGSGLLASNGEDGDGPTDTTSPGAGGDGGGNGGSGGAGSSGATGAGGGGGAGSAGGGGGGGGAGVIRTTDPTPPSGAISPPFS